MKKILIMGVAILTWFGGLTGNIHAEDVTEIMAKVYNRNDGNTEISLQELITCRYATKGRKLVCAEKPRVKVIESIRKDYGERGKDIRSLSIIQSPASERGIGFLQYDYEALDQDTDQWMYLSAMGKVRRIVSGNDDEPKQGSFFGSEFGYEDMEQMHVEDYTYKILNSETYLKRPTWVIEAVPTPKQARKSNYSKSVSWIDKERFLMLKAMLYNRQGKNVKRVSVRGIEQVDGIWVMREFNVNNLETKRLSTMKVQKIAYNIPVDDAFLTQRALTDGAFRENHLQTLRAHLK
ncbi:outer membrane lipoprotein-sorting protein [Deltaproteobacteria bacterium TL4]